MMQIEHGRESRNLKSSTTSESTSRTQNLVVQNNFSDKPYKLNALKQNTNQYKHLFIQRTPGQKMSDDEAKWIINTFARMRCDSLFFDFTDTQIMSK